MTRTPNPSNISARVRRAVVGAAIVGVASLATFTGGADAAPRTKSDVIAAEADRAVEALDRWIETQNPVDYVRFVQSRDLAASMTEVDVELAPGSLRDAWSSVSITKQHTVLSAISQLGVPYRNIKAEPGVGFDCSGLTIWAFGEAGVEIPRVSRDQINGADGVERADAEPGDLVYYPGHISIYLGADSMVHSPNSGSHVEVTHLPSKSLRFGDAVGADDVERADAEASDVPPAH